jgi:AcrR family transcriptional regulator
MVSTAAAVFARQGYDQTTMQDLAGSMGLATGALYHYFGSKEQLLMAIFDQLAEPILSRAREISLSDEPPADRLRALVRLWVAHVIEYRESVLVFQQERHMIESEPRWRATLDNHRAFQRIIRHTLDEVHAAGRRAHDPRVEVGALMGMVNYTPTWYQPEGRLTPDEIADGYLELFLGPP